MSDEPSCDPSWYALSRRALHDARIAALLDAVRHGHSPELSLISCVLDLSAALEATQKYAADLLARQSPVVTFRNNTPAGPVR